ncbi:MAG TPA: hypothetical protein VL286_09445 [Rhizomicrobium sp.]|nr:hypothetical protein [Rhizomicrobium sp.]
MRGLIQHLDMDTFIEGYHRKALANFAYEQQRVLGLACLLPGILVVVE